MKSTTQDRCNPAGSFCSFKQRVKLKSGLFTCGGTKGAGLRPETGLCVLVWQNAEAQAVGYFEDPVEGLALSTGKTECICLVLIQFCSLSTNHWQVTKSAPGEIEIVFPAT